MTELPQPAEFSSLTFPWLKQLCRERGLKVSGFKETLVQRLVNPRPSDRADAIAKTTTDSDSSNDSKEDSEDDSSFDSTDYSEEDSEDDYESEYASEDLSAGEFDESGNPVPEEHPRIVQAVMRSDLSALKRYIANGDDLDERRQWTETQDKGMYEKSWRWYDYSALQMACNRGKVVLVLELLRAGADPLTKSCHSCDTYETAREAVNGHKRTLIPLLDAVLPIWSVLNPNGGSGVSVNTRTVKPDLADIQSAIDKTMQKLAEEKAKAKATERPWVCPTCKRDWFHKAHNLAEHMRDTGHGDLTQFAKCEDCNKYFKDNSALAQHCKSASHKKGAARKEHKRLAAVRRAAERKLRAAKRKRKTTCVCGQKFKNGRALAKHMVDNSHGDFRSVEQCPECHLFFVPSVQSLKKHLREAHKKKPSGDWIRFGNSIVRVEYLTDKQKLGREVLHWG